MMDSTCSAAAVVAAAVVAAAVAVAVAAAAAVVAAPYAVKGFFFLKIARTAGMKKNWKWSYQKYRTQNSN